MTGDPYERGMSVRPAVLRDEHLDPAIEPTTPFTRELQELKKR